jgi:hypothetical protein
MTIYPSPFPRVTSHHSEISLLNPNRRPPGIPPQPRACNVSSPPIGGLARESADLAREIERTKEIER